MATVTEKMEKKIDVCLQTAKMMAEVEGVGSNPKMQYFDHAYWTGYTRAIEQVKRILSGSE